MIGIIDRFLRLPGYSTFGTAKVIFSILSFLMQTSSGCFGVCTAQQCRLIDIVCGYLSILAVHAGRPTYWCLQSDKRNQRERERERPVAWPRTHDKRGVVFIHVVVDVVVAVVAQMHLAWRWLATTMMTLHVWHFWVRKCFLISGIPQFLPPKNCM